MLLIVYVITTVSYTHLIVAPSFSEEARAIFAKKKNLRLLQLSDITKRDYTYSKAKTVLGGLLIQDMDSVSYTHLCIAVSGQTGTSRFKDLVLK